MPSNAELAGAAQRGDSVNLGILLERHRAPLDTLALRMLGHRPQAQDADQDAFLIALRRIDQLRDVSLFKSCCVLLNMAWSIPPVRNRWKV